MGDIVRELLRCEGIVIEREGGGGIYFYGVLRRVIAECTKITFF